MITTASKSYTKNAKRNKPFGVFEVIMVNINTFFGWHSWRYRNPYSRRCLECGEQQTVYCYDLKHVQTRQWWEVDKNGDQLKKCSTKESQ
jgi:hypothetical protein